MGDQFRSKLRVLCAIALTALGGGCAAFDQRREPIIPVADVPNERQKTILTEYVIESPDILQIDLIEAVPRSPYRIRPFDVLAVNVTGTPANDPIASSLAVETDGTIFLGQRYGRVQVTGLSAEDAKSAIQKQLAPVLKDPIVIVAVVEGRGSQLLRGQHLVRPDGIVSLGSYGNVQVAGKTVREAKQLIEAQLAQTLQSPEVVISVAAYNSKTYYIIFDFGGAGQQIVRQPVTGNDTVLDALSQVNGLPSVSDPHRVWVARAAGSGECDQILNVDWQAVTCRGRSETNYQLLPGDRLYVQAYPLVRIDVSLARILSPVERLLGFTLLGAGTASQIRNAVDGTGNAGGF